MTAARRRAALLGLLVEVRRSGVGGLPSSALQIVEELGSVLASDPEAQVELAVVVASAVERREERLRAAGLVDRPAAPRLLVDLLSPWLPEGWRSRPRRVRQVPGPARMRLVRLEEIARHAGVSASTARYWASSGRVPGGKFPLGGRRGEAWIVSAEHFEVAAAEAERRSGA